MFSSIHLFIYKTTQYYTNKIFQCIYPYIHSNASIHLSTKTTQFHPNASRRFYPGEEDFKTIKKEFADFALFMNAFENPDSIEDRADFEPKQWWGTHGVSTKLLKNLALKVLGQPASSSCCERNWNTYGFIHSAARNKLTPT